MAVSAVRPPWTLGMVSSVLAFQILSSGRRMWLTGTVTRGFGESPAAVPRSAASLNAIGAGHLPGLLGIEIVAWADGEVTGRLPIRPDLFAPNGFVHAASVVALADTLCGYGCRSGRGGE